MEKTRRRLPSLPYVVGGDCFAPGGGARRGVDPGGGGLGPNPPRSQTRRVGDTYLAPGHSDDDDARFYDWQQAYVHARGG